MNTSRQVDWDHKEANPHRNGSAGAPEGGYGPYYYKSDTTNLFW